MRRLVVILVLALAAPSGAKVWVTPYRCDEMTPLAPVDPNQPTVYRDVMVGTRLVLIVTSDAPGLYPYISSTPAPNLPIPGPIPGVSPEWLVWKGTLRVPWADLENHTLNGILSGRGYNKRTSSYEGSVLPAAGQPPRARVRYVESFSGASFDLNVESSSVAGDWFILDYRAERTGACSVLFGQPADLGLPTETLSFRHVPSRDFNGDTTVDFKDFALLASHWDSAVSADPNSPGSEFDLNEDMRVDLGDVALFGEYWLERADGVASARDPNSLPTDRQS